MLDDHLLLCHACCPLSEGHRGDHGQELRREANSERNGEEDGLEERVVKGDTGQKDEENLEEDGLQNQETEAPDASFELGFWGPVCQALHDIPKGRIATGGRDERSGTSADDGGAETHAIGSFSQVLRRGVLLTCSLFNRHGLTCQRGLLHIHIDSLQQVRISRDEVASREANDIAGD
jgi:hypothetical protein